MSNRQSSLEEERARRFSRVGAAQLFSFNAANQNVFSNIMSHQAQHLSIKRESIINEFQLRQKTAENKGFPTRHADIQRKDYIRVSLNSRPKELKYDLAERMKSRTLKTRGNDSDEDRKNIDTYRTQNRNVPMRRRKVILEGSDDEDLRHDSDIDRDKTTRKAITNATINNTIASTTNYLTAATGNRNTVANARSMHSRASSERSDNY